MSEGTIIHVSDKGYGFIKPKENLDGDIFFHMRRSKHDQLSVGDRVSFKTEMSKARLNAVDVTLI